MSLVTSFLVLPQDISKIITSLLDDKTLLVLLSLHCPTVQLKTFISQPSWWHERVITLLSINIEFREGDWCGAYYILLCEDELVNHQDNELATLCLLATGRQVTQQDIQIACEEGCSKILKLLLPLADPNAAHLWNPKPLIVALNDLHINCIEVLLQDTRTEVDEFTQVMLELVESDRIAELLSLRSK